MRDAGSSSAILITDHFNVTYLTGFTGEDSYLLILPSEEILITDGRFTTQLQDECPSLKLAVRDTGVLIHEFVTEVLTSSKVSQVSVESTIPLGAYLRIQEAARSVKLTPISGLVSQLREIKDREEIAEIRFAIKVSEKAFGVLRAALRHGQTEKELADELEYQTRLFGGQSCSFTPIIAIGPRAALPHARASDGRIGDFEFVLIDWGAKGRLYVSDLTRVLVTGRIPPKLERVYGVVLNAQQQAIATIRPGVRMKDVDAVAREVIAKAGFGEYFTHSLGHGIGLEVHEAPRLAPKQDRQLQPGMVVTVEPGVYLPGWGGVRIEDDVLVTRAGCEVLTSVPKQLEECVVI